MNDYRWVQVFPASRPDLIHPFTGLRPVQFRRLVRLLARRGGDVVAPRFVLYDYSWLAPRATTEEESVRCAHGAGVVCTDEKLHFPDPYPNRESWCSARLAETEKRLTAIDAAVLTVLIGHWPLRRKPTYITWHPEFAQWWGTDRTADWHLRFRAAAAVYGHQHIPRKTWHDGVPFEDLSLGHPRERNRRGGASQPVRYIPHGRP